MLLESLVKCAHREFELWTLSAEPVCANAGLEGEALEEVLSGAAVNEDYTSKYELPWSWRLNFECCEA